MKVAVIGGGVSGLSTAFYLERKGVSVKLFEKEERLGGKMRTVYGEGFIVETGPNGFLDGKPYTLDLVKALGIEEALYPSSDKSRKRFIYTKGRLVKLPEDPVSFLLSPLLSLKGKLRLLGELFVPPLKVEDETLASFVRRRLGEEALNKLLDPMVAGIFAGDPERMSLKAAFPAIYNLEREYGGLIKGLIVKLRESKGKGSSGPAGPGGRLTSFKRGVSQLIEALERELRGRVELGVSVSLKKRGNRWLVSYGAKEEEFDAVVLSTPAYGASEILKGVSKELSELLSEIEYSPISVVALGFKKEGLGHDLDGFGFLVPKEEGRRILGALWDSSVFPNRAPEGKALIRVMIGGARQPHLVLKSPKELALIAVEELVEIMGIRRAPDFIKVFRHPKGIPHYTLGHAERVERIFKLGRELGNLYFCNNAYTGVGVNDCTKAARETAEKIVKEVR
ncbi:protoporphyrinogen oxidase [Thermovibrio sp.]